MSKKDLSEQDICLRYITPALESAGWDKMKQIRTEYTFTDGQVIVRGNISTRGKRKRADYLLSYKSNVPIAVVEAKDNKHFLGDGMQQAIEYAKILDVPFAYSSNGDGFIEHDMESGRERELSLDEFPTPEELWSKYKHYKNIDTKEQEDIITESYHFSVGDKAPRYYQRIAVNRAIEAIAKGSNRLLLVMATGTGKTYTAFQIMWRLWKAGKVKRILYLADRNILIDQTIYNDFKPFEGVITKVKNRTMDSSYEIHMALYQQLVGQDGERVFEEFKPDFFDLIIVDEAHRGSVKEDSQWRQILEYFNSAIQIGLTATPKETKTVSNIDYFGEPIFTYSLKQGIQDGFLAPYKVLRVGLNVDLEGFRPYKGQTDIHGNEIEDREYNTKDYDRNLVIDERTKEVAKRITEFLKLNDRYMKTIVFCVDIEHANRMRMALIQENTDIVKDHPNYIMKFTGDDAEGRAQLDNFIAVNSKFPTIAVTSELLSTGVDAKMCKLIVIDKELNSQIMFKQILGRGTRIREEDGKTYFTFMDFRNVSRLFADPEFDGDPVKVIEVEGKDPIPPGGEDDGDQGQGDIGTGYEETEDGGDVMPDPPGKYYVKGVNVRILNERVQYIDIHGKLITESIKDYSKRHILEHYDTLDSFIKRWGTEAKKQAIIDELKDEGVLLDALREEVGQDIDDFDLILHVAFDKKPLSRAERANNVKKKGYLHKYSYVAQQVLNGLLEKYKDAEVLDFSDTKILELKPFTELGTPIKLVKEFGNKQNYIKAVKELEAMLYA
ncbi:type I restriction enzyme R subunit [Anaerosolibacter carboniphilus]|uniref:Type I restriction enzyme R subunit n=1 Tax=Anaerosolibacter carboniphilus TaxID=1417629 RepID=A0A841L758_9FIRM|nr:DEAD/DEAH box helicase family protein [Anaerosolibacter carboniphilus]MBB6218105.1 type I restriction enzyme R subunit [Anaerosolibacter carboniphilus]